MDKPKGTAWTRAWASDKGQRRVARLVDRALKRLCCGWGTSGVVVACREGVGYIRGMGTCPSVCVEWGASKGAGSMSEGAGVHAERVGHMQRAWGTLGQPYP